MLYRVIPMTSARTPQQSLLSDSHVQSTKFNKLVKERNKIWYKRPLLHPFQCCNRLRENSEKYFPK